MRRARGGEPQLGERPAQCRGHVALEQPLGGGAVEADQANAAMRLKKAREIIRRDSQSLDFRVETAGAARAGAHIPQRDAALGQPAQPVLIGQFDAGAEQPPHQRPKGVARLRVILPRGQRSLPRQRAQDQHAGVGAGNRREAEGVGGGGAFRQVGLNVQLVGSFRVF